MRRGFGVVRAFAGVEDPLAQKRLSLLSLMGHGCWSLGPSSFQGSYPINYHQLPPVFLPRLQAPYHFACNQLH